MFVCYWVCNELFSIPLIPSESKLIGTPLFNVVTSNSERGSGSWTADGQSCSMLQALISLEEKGWKLSELPLVEMFCLESLSIRHYEDIGRRQNPRSREKKIINIKLWVMGYGYDFGLCP